MVTSTNETRKIKMFIIELREENNTFKTVVVHSNGTEFVAKNYGPVKPLGRTIIHDYNDIYKFIDFIIETQTKKTA